MKGVNKVILVGALGDAPKSGTTKTGKKWAQMSLATNETHKDQSGNTTETTEWHRLVIWDKLADIATKYLLKGSQIYVEGKLSTRSYDKNGVKHYLTEIVVSNLVMLGSKKNDGNSGGGIKPEYDSYGQPLKQPQQAYNSGYGQQNAGGYSQQANQGYGGYAQPQPAQQPQQVQQVQQPQQPASLGIPNDDIPF